ncbi:HPr kinase/phosphorylase [Afifella sp. IM 167]|uniref:HPr kinase/phosphorylase n=1 Tax=Afifella sp. IM 167 TaxID=2033586 RepID=UPI001CCF7965|nr:HPr kinase/phosphatase C-terminal domain-containing protein [Afifella sp. IM 167]MBZ8133639.1 hypothetical protein [Afifella sp. IM 167]
MTLRIHATAIVFAGRGVLIRGASGSGKSSLAWRAIAAGGRLVADDYCDLSLCSGRVVATPPAATFGLMELRGRGILRLACERAAVIRLVVDLLPGPDVPRLPQREELSTDLLGLALPRQPAPACSPLAFSLMKEAIFAADGASWGLAT